MHRAVYLQMVTFGSGCAAAGLQVLETDLSYDAGQWQVRQDLLAVFHPDLDTLSEDFDVDQLRAVFARSEYPEEEDDEDSALGELRDQLQDELVQRIDRMLTADDERSELLRMDEADYFLWGVSRMEEQQ